jgi:hypothetical protein
MDMQVEKRLIPWETRLRYDAFVIGLFALALLAGWGIKTWAVGRTTAFTTPDSMLSLRYPASWVSQVKKGKLLSVRDLQSEGTFKATFSVEAMELDPAAIEPVQDLAERFAEDKGQDLTAYRILETGDSEVDGLEAVRISYAYIDEPVESPFQTSLPVVVQGVDVFVIQGSRLYVFTFSAPAVTFSQQAEIVESILDSVDLEE